MKRRRKQKKKKNNNNNKQEEEEEEEGGGEEEEEEEEEEGGGGGEGEDFWLLVSFVCLLFLVLYARDDTVISPTGMNKVFCILYSCHCEVLRGHLEMRRCTNVYCRKLRGCTFGGVHVLCIYSHAR